MNINFDQDKELVNMLLLLSHIVLAIIFIICLKNSRPVLLSMILSLIVCYICYTVQEIVPWYLIPSIGIIIYGIEMVISNMSYDSSKLPLHLKIIKSLWRMPFMSIISYYIILASQSLLIKS